MTYTRRIAPLLIAGAVTCLAACDDESNTTPDMTVVDMVVPGPDTTPDPEPDADRDMDVVDLAVDAEIDMEIDAEIDMEIDAEIDANTIVMPGEACEEGGEACEGEWRRCVDGACQVDLRPDVYVVNAIRVIEPAGSAQLIEMFIGDVVDQNRLNLIIEPGGYNDMNEYLFYIGNGGYRAGEYDYLRTRPYPIMNFFGFWRDDEENGLRWAPDDEVGFLLNVPSGSVENADGETVDCISQLVTTVELTMTPGLDAGGDPLLNASLSGSLLRSDAEQVEFRLENGAVLRLVDLLSPEDLRLDTDGDGVNDAYPFAFDADAAPVVFVGDPPAADGSNRDPNPMIVNDPACNQ